MQEKLWKAITSDAAEKRKQDDLEKAEMREPDPQIGGLSSKLMGIRCGLCMVYPK